MNCKILQQWEQVCTSWNWIYNRGFGWKDNQGESIEKIDKKEVVSSWVYKLDLQSYLGEMN